DLCSRFRNEDTLTFRGILKDLVESGHVMRAGRGASVMFQCAGGGPTTNASDADVTPVDRRVANLVWVAVSRLGEGTFPRICEQVPSHEASIHRALTLLVGEG